MIGLGAGARVMAKTNTTPIRGRSHRSHKLIGRTPFGH